MRTASHPDRFVIVNGPEDGTEFSIVRSPFHIGSDPACTVNVRLDSAVHEHHALVTAVSDGYRIRCLRAGAVYVDGKRAGAIRSRIARAGALVQIGQTLLHVDCVADGLASRSHGIISENDVVWAVRQTVTGGYRAVTGLLRLTALLFGRLLSSWLLILAVFAGLYYFWPRFHDVVLNTTRWLVYSFYRMLF